MVNDKNMDGKQNCADQHQKISLSNGKSVFDAKKVQTDHSHSYRSPNEGAAFLFEKKSQYRNDYNIAGCNKTGFSYCGVFDPELLEITCQTETDSTADSPGEKYLLAFFLLFWCLVFLGGFSFRKPDQRKKYKSAHEETGGIEGEGSDKIHAYTLRHKSNTPDCSGQEKKQ